MSQNFINPFKAQYKIFLFSTVLMLVFSAANLKAQTDLKPEDFGKWETPGFEALSPDGNWLAYTVARVNEKNELRIHQLSDNTLEVVEEGTRAVFAKNSMWLAYSINVPAEEREKLTKAKKPVHNKVGIMNLTTGEKTEVEAISSFAFSFNGDYLLLKGYPGTDKKNKGVNVIIRDLAGNKDVKFGNISEYSWQDEGDILAMIVDSENKTGNGVRVYDPTNSTMKTLVSEETVFTGLTWREDSDDLATFQEVKSEDYDDATYKLLAWKGLSGSGTDFTFTQSDFGNFGEDDRIVSARKLKWSDDGNSLFFGTQEREPNKKKSDSDEKSKDESAKEGDDSNEPDKKKVTKSPAKDEVSTVEIWNAKDVDILAVQRLRASRFTNMNFLAVWDLENNNFVQLGDELTDNVSLAKGQKLAIGTDDTPYEFSGMFGRPSYDIYKINVADGTKEKIRDNVKSNYGISSGGKYYVYFEGSNFKAYDLESGMIKDLTSKLKSKFVNTEYDHPVPQKPAFGIAGWTENDASVLIYDKYDIWEVDPVTLAGKKLTNGARSMIRYRYVRLDREEKFIDRSKPIYISTYGDWTKKSGYSLLNPDNKLTELVWEEKNVGRLVKAKDSDTFAFLEQGFDDSPDYFTATEDWNNVKQISNTNPFQKDYHWGRSELVEYKNPKGRKLQGALFYPANYDPNKKYPMIVYIYEFLSQTKNYYVTPSERSYYNSTVFNSEGYFVLRPDIVFSAGDPGMSSIRTIERAVSAVVKTGMVDKDRVGLLGHSWGGYQTAFGVTQTDIFAAGIAGAPLTNLISMYGAVFWNIGMPETGHFEVGQERMGVPFYENPQAYIKNSPVFQVNKLKTPLMVEIGDKDGNVNWEQGLEYYNAARRAGKDFVLLVYPGENHGVRNKANQMDYQKRILKWFGHYLQGDPAPKWITEGLTYEEQQKLKKK